MLADFYFPGYSATNIVKDSTKSVQPSVFLSPSKRGGTQRKAESCIGGCVSEDASSLSLFLKELSGLAKRKSVVSYIGTAKGRAGLQLREWIFPAT